MTKTTQNDSNDKNNEQNEKNIHKRASRKRLVKTFMCTPDIFIKTFLSTWARALLLIPYKVKEGFRELFIYFSNVLIRRVRLALLRMFFRFARYFCRFNHF